MKGFTFARPTIPTSLAPPPHTVEVA